MGGKQEDWLHLVQDTDKHQTLMKHNELLSSHSESQFKNCWTRFSVANNNRTSYSIFKSQRNLQCTYAVTLSGSIPDYYKTQMQTTNRAAVSSNPFCIFCCTECLHTKLWKQNLQFPKNRVNFRRWLILQHHPSTVLMCLIQQATIMQN